MSPPKIAHGKIVCHCLQVTESQMLDAVRACKIRNIKDIIQYTQAGDGCTACHPLLQDYLERTASPCAQ